MHKVTTKRQVTIPQSVCKAMALQPGDYVEIFERDGMAHIIKMNKEDLAGKYNRLMKDKKFPSAETINKSIKKHVARKFLENDCG
jgi:AbrB family looped-hinge helix DNA binding protein